MVTESERRRPSLIVNSTANLVSLAAQICVGFILTPQIISFIGSEGHGLWVIVMSFVGYYGLFNAGLCPAIVRFLGLHRGRDDIDELNCTASTAFATLVFMGTVVCAALYLLAPAMGEYLIADSVRIGGELIPVDGAADKREQLVFALRILGLTAFCEFAIFTYGGIMEAYEKYVHINIAHTTRTLLRLGVIFLMLHSGWGIVGAVFGNFVATVVGALVIFLLSRITVPHVKVSPLLFSLRKLIELLRYGIFSFLLSMSMVMRSEISKVIIAKVIGIASASVFGVADLVIRYFRRLLKSILNVLMPRFLVLLGEDNHEELVRLYRHALAISAILTGGGLALVILLGEPFILIWVKHGDYAQAPAVLYVLAAALVLEFINYPSVMMLLAMAKHRWLSLFSLLEAFVNLFFTLLFVLKYDMGLLGVAYGALVAAIIGQTIIVPVHACSISGIKLQKYYLSFVRGLVPCALVLLPIYLLGCYDIHVFSFIVRFYQVCISGVLILLVYSLLAWWCMSVEMRVIFEEKWRKFVSGLLRLKQRLR